VMRSCAFGAWRSWGCTVLQISSQRDAEGYDGPAATRDHQSMKPDPEPAAEERRRMAHQARLQANRHRGPM
jgi:hypothetical protein